MDDPPIHRGVIDVDPTFAHELFDVARTQWVSDIPADGCQHDILWEMGPLKAHSHRLSPSVFTLRHRGRSYLTWPHMKIATEPSSRPTSGKETLTWFVESCCRTESFRSSYFHDSEETPLIPQRSHLEVAILLGVVAAAGLILCARRL